MTAAQQFPQLTFEDFLDYEVIPDAVLPELALTTAQIVERKR